MTKQNLVQSEKKELIKVSDLLSQTDLEIIKNNSHTVYVLPLEDSKGKFQGYFQLDSKVDSSFKALKSDSLGSQLLPIVTGG